jgi:flagellar biosynthesis protein FliP
MASVFQAAYTAGVQPLMENEVELPQAFGQASQPFQDFMLSHVREQDLQLFLDLPGEAKPETPQDVSLHILPS